ncbi:flagellar protein MotY [Legionella spiritensis]|uniref:Sodium-type flagellar protein n=1 Tax=Legionella spiritensis TaxID=452 RepID=A0A0W0ZAX3_LEGSP|nr:OmpA family protein [Legionella spiritensis]KTD66300.1 sodium-type flagellar protein [Legionella spiritensis]SNV48546.1 sodium-type flagellar protein [Legionella spiritensis]
MPSTRFFIHIIIPLLLINGLCSFPAKARVAVVYASPMGDENWRMSGNRLRCGLALTIPDYGVAYFEQYAAKAPHFILHKWQQVERPLTAAVYANQPVWKPQGASHFIAKTVISPGKYGIYLKREAALKALTYLAQGFQTRISYQSEQGFPVSVSLSPVRFQTVYAKYQKCLGSLLPFDYASVKTSVLLFETDDDTLSDAGKRQLQHVAQYVREDHKVKRISITGYADNRGRKSYNNAISEARAVAVKRYLLQLRVRKDLLDTTWVGVNDPAASNDTEEGMAQNRRVVIIIEK